MSDMEADMSDKEHENKTPSEALAEIVTSRLVEGTLVLEADRVDLQKDMATGKLKAEDWRLFVEKAIDKEPSNEQ